MQRTLPFGPGTAPFTYNRFLSVSTLTTSKLITVTLTLPMCPGKTFPLYTLPGSDVDPNEPRFYVS